MASPLKLSSQYLYKSPQTSKSLPGINSTVNTSNFLRRPHKSIEAHTKNNAEYTPKSKTLQVPKNINYDTFIFNTPNRSVILKNGVDKKLKILGKGRFGTVVKGIYKDHLVAVKITKNKRLIGERNILNLQHENIVTVLDIIAGDFNENVLIFMKYYPNAMQLESMLNEMPDNCIIDLCLDICKGVQFCHQNGILHLDLKPTNILIYKNHCKICDFGNSIKEDENDLASYNFQGTIIYTAPELLCGCLPSRCCDIYSLGILFWQLETKERPYKHLNNVDCIIYKVVKTGLRPDHCHGTAPMLNKSSRLQQIYRKCWDSKPQNRPNVTGVLHLVKSLL